jgi:hypothetical protein
MMGVLMHVCAPIACAHDRSSGDWLEETTTAENDATTAALQTLGGVGAGAVVSGAAAGVIGLFERNDGCLEAECVFPFLLTVGTAVLLELAIGAVVWGIGKARSGRGNFGSSIGGSIIGGALTAAGMIALVGSDDHISEKLWVNSLVITGPVAGASTLSALIAYYGFATEQVE